VAKTMLSHLIGGNKVRASISGAMAARDVKQMAAVMEVAREKKLESDPLFMACDRLMNRLIEQDKYKAALQKVRCVLCVSAAAVRVCVCELFIDYHCFAACVCVRWDTSGFRRSR
jgi:hypothetical protein